MVTAQLTNVFGSGVPSLVAPMEGVPTMVAIALAFLVASVMVFALGHWSRAS